MIRARAAELVTDGEAGADSLVSIGSVAPSVLTGTYSVDGGKALAAIGTRGLEAHMSAITAQVP
jgi:hypothetical protein